MNNFEDVIEQVHKHLDCDNQNWLFGAGISFNSKIPLMIPLTKKIEKDIAAKHPEEHKTFSALLKGLPEDAHIEFVLSHIGDLLALLTRSQRSEMVIDQYCYTVENLNELYKLIIVLISQIIRYGYKSATTEGSSDEIGTINDPIVIISHHQRFVKELFKRHSDLQNRKTLNFFTTNYDTLLEDALALEKKEIVDGFTGGAIGFWNSEEFSNSQSNKYHVYKLHGSIDWYKDINHGLIRSRYGTNYHSDHSNVLIYPQATKYVETQKDPFATLFNAFRNKLQLNSNNILAVCGYSFGDEHINTEIEGVLSQGNNNTTLIIFIKELWDGDNETRFLHPTLQYWMENPSFNKRIFILTDQGVYNGSSFLSEDKGSTYDWWSFDGLTNFLSGEVKTNAI